MTTEPKSKFTAYQNDDALKQDNAVKNLPSLTNGLLARAGGAEYRVSLWATMTGDVVTSYSGNLQPTDPDTAAKMQRDALAPVELPPKLDLAMGKIVLFKNDKGDNKDRPDFYGYSRTADGVNRHSVWVGVSASGAIMLRGSTETYVQKAAVTADPDTGAGRPTGGKSGVKQAHTPKR